MNKRMDRNRLNIGVYHLKPYARTEAHIKGSVSVVHCNLGDFGQRDFDRYFLMQDQLSIRYLDGDAVLSDGGEKHDQHDGDEADG